MTKKKPKKRVMKRKHVAVTFTRKELALSIAEFIARYVKRAGG